MKEINYEELDPGIRETVKFLRELGFNTTDSGDGVSKPSSPDNLKIPHVYILVEKNKNPLDEVDKLFFTLKNLELPMSQFGSMIEEHIEIQLTYDPYDNSSIIILLGLDDILLKSKVTI